MRGLDTNVLVRYLTQDDRSQSRKANAVIDQAAETHTQCFVDLIVLCELTWVLRGAYDLERSAIVAALDKMLSSPQLVLEQKDIVRGALDDYRTGPGDFADYLIGRVNREAGCARTATFNQRLTKSEHFEVL